MRNLPLLLLSSWLASGLHGAAAAQVGIYVVPGTSATPLGENDGRMIGCDKGCIQEWWLNDLDRQRAVMTGYLLARKRNADHSWDDNDYDFCIQPDASYHYLSYNVQTGARTPSRSICGVQVPRGVVEAELRSALPWSWITDHFPAHGAVTAYGWWPHDNGHPEEDNPSELHPLIWMATQGVVPTASLIAGQDLSRRFFVALWPVEETVEVVYNPTERTTVHPSGQTVVPINVLRETAYAQTMGAHVAADRVAIALWFPPPCLAWTPNGLVCASGGQFGYRAELQHSRSSLLHENVRFDVITDQQTNLKSGQVTVALTMDSPPSGELHYVTWDWLNNAPTLPQRTEQTSGPFNQTFALNYAPRDGYSQHEWALDIAGATVTQAELESVKRDASSTDPFGYDRTFVGSQRAYRIEPSAISLSTDQPTIPIRGTCPEQQVVRINTSNLLPGTTLPTSQWSVRLGAGPEGGEAADQWHTLAASNQYKYTSPTFIAEADPGDPTKLLVTFPPVPTSPDVNYTWADVVVGTATDIGEWLNDGMEVYATCPQDGSRLPDARAMPRFHRPETDVLIARLMRARGYAFDLAELPQRAKAVDREWLNAYMKWSTGEQISWKERVQLSYAVRRAAALPPSPAPTEPSKGTHSISPLGPSLRNARRMPFPVSNTSVPTADMACPNPAIGLTIQLPKGAALECKIGEGGTSRWESK
jgi:hypothetical protein